jgi:hypothetical protein
MQQPMLHFLVGGAVIFGAFSLAGGRTAAPPPPSTVRANEPDRHIVITQGRIETLRAGFAALWRRPPNDEELAGLIAEFVREEMLVREALTIGLDRDDVVIRRHLRNRMEFVAQDLATLRAPSDDDLRALLAAESDRFRLPAVLTFRHVFLDVRLRGEAGAREEAIRLLTLGQGPSGAAVLDDAGDRFLPGFDFQEVRLPQVARTFGESFASALEAAPIGRWSGPVASSYGLHLVLVDARTDVRLPALEDVAPALRAELSSRHRREALEIYYRSLLTRYTVAVQPPASTPATASPATTTPTPASRR